MRHRTLESGPVSDTYVSEAIWLLAIVAAFKDEISEYLGRGGYRVTVTEGRLRIYESELIPRVVVLEGGVGKELSQRGTRAIVERFRPDMVISAGFAGGAMTGANTGEAFFCDRLVAVDGPLYLWEKSEAVEHLDQELLDKVRANIPGGAAEYQLGACLTVPQFISNSSMKAWLGRTFEVRLIDMESYWVSEAARGSGVPQLAVKVMLDPVEESVPSFVGATLSRGRAYRALRGAAYLARNPMEAQRVFRLIRQVKRSRTALANFLERIVAAHTAFADH